MLAAAVPVFDPQRAPDDPVTLFTDWFDHAVDSGVPEPHSMTLATADAAGRPSARVLILKDLSADGHCHFASSAAGRKGRELAANPVAACTFYWPSVGRQIRVEGPVLLDPPAIAAADFAARSPTARAVAAGGIQSDTYDDLAQLRIAAAGTAPPDQPDWQSYAVRAQTVEFWQADPDRRHLRVRYTRSAGWTRDLLWP